MWWVDLNWLQDAELLGRIGRNALAVILDSLAPVLAEQGITLPDPRLPDARYFAELAATLRSQPVKLTAYRAPILGAGPPAPAQQLLPAGATPILADGPAQAGTQGSPPYVFRRVGKHWQVVFAGGRMFRLRKTLGARYLDYLLHEPNEPIRAFDLEVEVQPEKGEARVRNTFQPDSDAQAMREYRQALPRLKAQRADAKAAGDLERVAHLGRDIEAFESALREGGGAADTGERARNNVRKAVAAVMEKLSEGGAEEKAFAEHLRTHLSIGIECQYRQPQGRIWG